MHAITPQIEEAVREPHVLGVIGIGIHRKRERLRLRPHFDSADHQLDFAGWEPRVNRVGRARGDTSGHRHHTLQPQRIRRAKHRRGYIDDALGDAVMVPQIDKEQLAVVALAMDPPR